MKKMLGSALVAAFFCMLLAFTASTARAEVIGYTEDTENFPNMLETEETCSQAYGDFLSVAQPLNACRHLNQAKANLAAQQKIKQQMGTMKNCKDCAKMMVQTDEAAAAYQEQIKLYQGQCPGASDQAKLMEKLPKETKKVCSACKNKWPGTLGPGMSSPCK
jgi:hypothetical protein